VNGYERGVERTFVKKGFPSAHGTTILSNVVIGENAIVGAGNTVNKDVPANAIAERNPERLLSYVESNTNCAQ
jgi:acetyltransferase-like isoleucine patch superfamily enzyme